MNFFKKKFLKLRWKLAFSSTKKKKMEEIFALVRQEKMAGELLDRALKDGIDIRFMPELVGGLTRGILRTDIKTGEQGIFLCPAGNSPADIAGILAHELRHHWQYKKVPFSEPQHQFATPSLSFIFNRVREADAYVFQARFNNLLQTGQQGGGNEKRLWEDAFVNFLPAIKEYDSEHVSVLHAWHTADTASKTDFGTVTPDGGLTMKKIRAILKAGIDDDAPSYFDGLSDQKFEALMLRHSAPEARKVVRLIEAFRNAAAANDNEVSESLRKAVNTRLRRKGP